jgi:hypothetical protein
MYECLSIYKNTSVRSFKREIKALNKRKKPVNYKNIQRCSIMVYIISTIKNNATIGYKLINVKGKISYKKNIFINFVVQGYNYLN